MMRHSHELHTDILCRVTQKGKDIRSACNVTRTFVWASHSATPPTSLCCTILHVPFDFGVHTERSQVEQIVNMPYWILNIWIFSEASLSFLHNSWVIFTKLYPHYPLRTLPLSQPVTCVWSEYEEKRRTLINIWFWTMLLVCWEILNKVMLLQLV